jgi:SpoVK/Ycf46/Vps4 family AAA+-type ATPase
MEERREKQFTLGVAEARQLRKLAAAREPHSVVLLTGTGDTDRKRLAAELTRAVARPVHRVPLNWIVSKYIGETEKNLARAFVEAEREDAVLLFDEADALFGERSDVRDSHDRHANQQVGHLLALMEQYDGIVILATNLTVDLDPELGRFLRWAINEPA